MIGQPNFYNPSSVPDPNLSQHYDMHIARIAQAHGIDIVGLQGDHEFETLVRRDEPIVEVLAEPEFPNMGLEALEGILEDWFDGRITGTDKLSLAVKARLILLEWVDEEEIKGALSSFDAGRKRAEYSAMTDDAIIDDFRGRIKTRVE